MDGLHIYISPDKLSVNNERVHISFDRHFPDEMSAENPVAPEVRVLRGSDIPRLFDAINALNGLSVLPPGNEHAALRNSMENRIAREELAALREEDKEKDAEMAGNTRRRRS